MIRVLLAAVLVLCSATVRAADTPSPPVANELAGTWRWVGFSSGKERLSIGTPDRYTLEFLPGDRIALKADCNRAAGGVTFGEAGAIKIGPMAMTRAMCPPGSLGDRFAQAVERATHWSIHDGALLLEQPADSGTLRFLHAP
jgi:heat shock protein HslJ